MGDSVHTFHALAFVENFSLKELALRYPDAKRTHHRLWFPAVAGGMVFMFPSGALVFHNVGQAGREGSVQEALELVTDVARDKRLVWLEISIVLLIVFEIGLNLVRR